MAGIVGAFLGSLLSAVCIILTGQLGYMASICGLAMLYFFALLGAVPMTLAGLRANSAADLFRMDADCAQVEDGYYMTQAGDVLYGVMIQTDCSEKDALDVLLAPIGDYRMDPDLRRGGLSIQYLVDLLYRWRRTPYRCCPGGGWDANSAGIHPWSAGG